MELTEEQKRFVFTYFRQLKASLSDRLRINDVVWTEFSTIFDFPRDWCSDVYYLGWEYSSETRKLKSLIHSLLYAPYKKLDDFL